MATGLSRFLHRVVGAAALDVSTYEDVEADRGATAQALLVVLFSSLAAGVGIRGLRNGGPGDIAVFSAIALMAWAAWALLTYEIGARILPERQTRADVGELLRTLGFAAAPGMVRVVGILPGTTIPVFAAVAVWMLVAMIVAVRQALDYKSTGRAIAVCGLGWMLSLVFAIVLGLLVGPHVS